MLWSLECTGLIKRLRIAISFLVVIFLFSTNFFSTPPGGI